MEKPSAKDLRRTKSLRQELAAEARVSKAIQKDPFTHMPPALRQTDAKGMKVRHAL